MLYSAGTAIWEFRKRKHITQEELCHGICSVATLSKIENCTHNPNKSTLDALLNRLGMPSCEYNIPVSESEYKRQMLYRKIADKICHHDYDYSKELDKYEQCGKDMSHLEKQFYLYAKANIFRHNARAEKAEVLALMIEAIRLTIPDFDIAKIPAISLMTQVESALLDAIATLLYDTGQTTQAISLLYFLKSFYEKDDIDYTLKAAHYPSIVYNLSCCVSMAGQYKECLELVETAIDMCINTSNYDALPMLLYNKGYALCSLEKCEEGKKYLLQALTILEATKQEKIASLIKDDLNKTFKLNLL